MFSDTEIEEFYELKELIVFEAMNPNPTTMQNIELETLNDIYDYFIAQDTEDESGYGMTVDRIIARVIVLNRANLINNITEDLDKALAIIGAKDRVYKNTYMNNASQFEVLRKVFEYYKATAQEMTVLEAMYKYNIPRTIEQEQRLAFLKKGNTNAPKVFQVEKGSNVFTYEYRALQWGEKEITDYIESFTMNSQKFDIPMVVDSYEKSVMVQSFTWENEKIIPVIKECLKENFGDRYYIESMESSTTTDTFGEVTDSILITENGGGGKGYPWLGFLVVGEQLTLKQMNLSIFVLYLSDKIANKSNIMETNEKIISNVTVLKMKQNPRINNYIGTINNILIDTLEKWINNNISADIYG